MSKILVTGGAGFIGSHFVDYLIAQGDEVVVLDKLTYASDLSNLDLARQTGKLVFITGDIGDLKLVDDILRSHQINSICHLAAETHVDNSIDAPDTFIQTNILGTYALLKAANHYWQQLGRPDDFRFLHISTDEVFGDLKSTTSPAFTEQTPYAPNSPYSASKASSDHLVRAWRSTFDLPVIISNCSNNFGTRQHKEKLIPTIIRNALSGSDIPIYGTGDNIRDWLWVTDHCKGLYLALTKGALGHSYCFGANNELKNNEIAQQICEILDKIAPRNNGSYAQQITFIDDRKGHDWRYAIDYQKAKEQLGFSPSDDYDEKLYETVSYYIDQHQASNIKK